MLYARQMFLGFVVASLLGAQTPAWAVSRWKIIQPPTFKNYNEELAFLKTIKKAYGFSPFRIHSSDIPKYEKAQSHPRQKTKKAYYLVPSSRGKKRMGKFEFLRELTFDCCHEWPPVPMQYVKDDIAALQEKYPGKSLRMLLVGGSPSDALFAIKNGATVDVIDPSVHALIHLAERAQRLKKSERDRLGLWHGVIEDPFWSWPNTEPYHFVNISKYFKNLSHERTIDLLRRAGKKLSPGGVFAVPIAIASTKAGKSSGDAPSFTVQELMSLLPKMKLILQVPNQDENSVVVLRAFNP